MVTKATFMIFRLFVMTQTKIFCSPKHPDWLWGSSSLLSNRYCGSFLGNTAVTI
jgi:hypothetical protein